MWGQGRTLWGVESEHTNVWGKGRQCSGVQTRYPTRKTHSTHLCTCALVRVAKKREGGKKHALRDTKNNLMVVGINGVERENKTGRGHAPHHLCGTWSKCWLWGGENKIMRGHSYDVSGRHWRLIGPRGKVYWRGPITLEILYVIICVGQPWPYLRYLPLGST